MNELEIIQSIQNGFKDDFVKLYDAYIKKIYDFIFYKIGDRQQAQDLTSEVFMKVYKNIDGFDINKPNVKFSSWIYTIANNILIDHYRMNEKSNSIDYEWLNNISVKSDVLDNLENRHRLQQVMDYLNTLDPVKKDIFIMRIWDDIPYDEISDITGKSVENCKTIFSRTLKSIVDRFGMQTLLLFILLHL